MASSLRRLALDHASLRRSGLPPNFIFPLGQDEGVLPDDLTQLTILLTGAHGTPYSQGLWELHLRMPIDYPKNPPRATFKTRMWHPNVEESTGAVCLETLKRDWDPKLTLKDILLTIGCLLIHPNPDSALNSAAGSLLQESYEGFAEQARLMTSIHARIPSSLRREVDAARRRGEEDQPTLTLEKEARVSESRMNPRQVTNLLRRRLSSNSSRPSPLPLAQESENQGLSDDDENHDPCKENDPSQSPSLVVQSPRSPRKNVLGKRPLSELPTPTEADDDMTESEKNIAVNQVDQNSLTERPKKSPKLAMTSAGVNASGSLRAETVSRTCMMDSSAEIVSLSAEEEKENINQSGIEKSSEITKIPIRATPSSDAATIRPTLRKVSNINSSKVKQQPRIGMRRL